MLSLPTLKIAAALAVLAGVAAFAAHYRHVSAEASAYGSCRAIEAGKPPKGKACDKAIAGGLETAARARRCELDLAEPARAWSATATCAAPIVRLIADRDARAAEVADRDATINKLKAEISAAITRAEARGRSLERNKRNADAAITAAPRAADGRIVCGFDCLRALAGEPPG